MVQSQTYKVLCVLEAAHMASCSHPRFTRGSRILLEWFEIWLIFIHHNAVWLKGCSLTEKIHKAGNIALD